MKKLYVVLLAFSLALGVILVPNISGASRVEAASPVLQIGSTGQDVVYLQTLLNNEGFPITVDENYGQQTVAVVKWFQWAHGLTQDGIVGQATWNILVANYKPTPTPKPAGYEWVLSYGQWDFSNIRNAVGIFPSYTGDINMYTFITVSDKGVTINKVNQECSFYTPIEISKNGTSIISSTSSNINQKAISYSDFKIAQIIADTTTASHDESLYTYFTVTNIDKVNKKVTVYIDNEYLYY